jgi:hypothetical protein
MHNDLIWAYNQMAKKLSEKPKIDLWEITGCAQMSRNNMGFSNMSNRWNGALLLWNDKRPGPMERTQGRSWSGMNKDLQKIAAVVTDNI